MANLLSEAAQRLIDEHRQQQQVQELSPEGDQSIESILGVEAPASASGAPATVFESKAAKAAVKVYPRYTAEAMVQLMVDHPEYSHAQFAAHFGYRASWFAGVLVSKNLQEALDPRRHEVNNPMLTGTMDDIMRALTLQAVTVLQSRLDNEKATDDLVIKALGAGVKALGMGTAGQAPTEPAAPKTLNDLAAILSKPKAIEATPARDWTIEATTDMLPR